MRKPFKIKAAISILLFIPPLLPLSLKIKQTQTKKREGNHGVQICTQT